MTATTPDIGLRARWNRLARGSVVFAIALGACGISAVAGPAAAETTTDAVQLHLVAGVRGIVATDTATTATVTVENSADTSLSAGRVSIELNRTALPDDATLTAWLDDEKASGTFGTIASASTSAVIVDGTATTSVELSATALGELSAGVYPLRATLSDTESDASATSVIVVSDTGITNTAVIVPITATPDGGTLLTAGELTALTAADGALTAILDGVASTSAILAIDPAIPAAIRVLGTAAPTPATDWLQRLDALPNERFALQFGDADVTSQSQAGLGVLLEPTTLSVFLDPANFDPVIEPTATPDPAGEAEEPSELPDDTALTAISGATPAILWPRSDVTDDDLTRFADYLGGGVTSILSSSSVDGTGSAHASATGHDLLLSSSSATALLSDAASENDAAARQQLIAAASAHLALATSEAEPLLIAIERDETRSAAAVRDAILAVDSPAVGLSTLLSSPTMPATLVDVPDGANGARLQQLLATEETIAAFSTILDEPEQLTSRQRIRIMRASAVGLSDAAYQDAVLALDAATKTTLEAVDIPPSSTIQLLSANADLPFSVRNDLAWPVNVLLTARPSDPRLDVEPVTAAVIQPGTTQRILVPVSARVGGGEVSLRLTLSSPSGVVIGTPETVRVSVRAEWEAIGLTLFGGLIVLLIGVGILRTVRRRRHESMEASATGSDVSAGSDE